MNQIKMMVWYYGCLLTKPYLKDRLKKMEADEKRIKNDLSL